MNIWVYIVGGLICGAITNTGHHTLIICISGAGGCPTRTQLPVDLVQKSAFTAPRDSSAPDPGS